MSTAIVLFNRDLRVHDQAALSAAADYEAVIPLFVLDPSISAPPNRLAFLIDCLRDLDRSLTKLGAPLVIRRGKPAAPGEVTPSGGDHFKVFTAYWRRWSERATARPLLGVPRALRGVAGVGSDALPMSAPTATRLPLGGETTGCALMRALVLDGYAGGGHDDLAGDRTSRLSPYLHFGCVSAREALEGASGQGLDGAAFIRQLWWRDFFLQFEAAQPELCALNRSCAGRDNTERFDAWATGRTGYPVVDAGMRQLLEEGWMHNRARMITASFLTRDLGVDWRLGAAHFMHHLVDGDVANNNGNWRWVAGDGLNTRPGRELNPLRQAKRFDPTGAYVARHVTEAASPDYPAPIVEQYQLAAVRSKHR